MTRELLIQDTISRISKLPDEKLQEVSDFVVFLLSKLDNELFNEGIIKYVTTSAESFKFLEEDEDLYTIKDVKERF